MAARLSYTAYTAEAKLAIRHTREVMPLGAHDSFSWLIRHGLRGQVRAKWAIGDMYAAVDNDMKAREKTDPSAITPYGPRGTQATFGDWRAYIESMARRAKEHGVGNCGEHAAVAFKFLEERGIRPLDYLAMIDGDHGMVLLGATRRVTENNFLEWSGESIICDPWSGRTQVAGILAVWHPHKHFRSMLHVE